MKATTIVPIVIIWAVLAWPLYLTITRGFNKPYNVTASFFIWGGFALVAIGLTIMELQRK